MNKQQGFSLIELAVVLVIGSFLLTAIITTAGNYLDEQRAANTFKKMQVIMKAVNNYVDENGDIPCPARHTAITTYTFGQSEGGSGTCTVANLEDSGNIVAGAVPVNDLNLDPLYTLDGWGRKLTYVMDQRLSDSTIYSSTVLVDQPIIDIKNIGGGITRAINTHTITHAATVLISYGKNGYGAYEANATTRNANASKGDANEQSNNSAAGFDAIFVQGLITDPDSGSTYDDIVMYRQKHQFTNIYE